MKIRDFKEVRARLDTAYAEGELDYTSAFITICHKTGVPDITPSAPILTESIIEEMAQSGYTPDQILMNGEVQYGLWQYQPPVS